MADDIRLVITDYNYFGRRGSRKVTRTKRAINIIRPLKLQSKKRRVPLIYHTIHIKTDSRKILNKYQ